MDNKHNTKKLQSSEKVITVQKKKEKIKQCNVAEIAEE